MSERFTVVIPARLGSTRLPNKVLRPIGGKPMVRLVHELSEKSGAARVILAVDDERTAEAVPGAETCLTSRTHRSGTERIAEVVERLDLDPGTIIVNVQADEPLLPPALIGQVARNLRAAPDAVMTTLCEPLESTEALFDPNVVKVARDRFGYALYFSRAPIPWRRDGFEPVDEPAPGVHFRHVGVYAYRAGYVCTYVRREPSALEVAESLEQLRVLHYGERIHVGVAVQGPGPGVDTEADLAMVRARVEGS